MSTSHHVLSDVFGIVCLSEIGVCISGETSINRGRSRVF